MTITRGSESAVSCLVTIEPPQTFLYLVGVVISMSFLDKLRGRHQEEHIGGGPPQLEPLFPKIDVPDFEQGITSPPHDEFQPRSLSQPMQSPQMQSFQQMREQMVSPLATQNYQPVTSPPSKDFEMVNSKLDAIKSMLENLSLRLERLEAVKPLDEKFAKKRDEWRY